MNELRGSGTKIHYAYISQWNAKIKLMIIVLDTEALSSKVSPITNCCANCCANSQKMAQIIKKNIHLQGFRQQHFNWSDKTANFIYQWSVLLVGLVILRSMRAVEMQFVFLVEQCWRRMRLYHPWSFRKLETVLL